MTSIIDPNKCDRGRVSSPHSGAKILMLDGGVRDASPNLTQVTWQRAITPNDGFPFGDDW